MSIEEVKGYIEGFFEKMNIPLPTVRMAQKLYFGDISITYDPEGPVCYLVENNFSEFGYSAKPDDALNAGENAAFLWISRKYIETYYGDYAKELKAKKSG